MDPRIEKLAKILVHDSLKVQPKEKVMIAMIEECSVPYAHALYREIVKAGAFAQIQYNSELLRNDIMAFGDDEQISWIPQIEAYGMQWADCYIALRGASNLFEHERIDPVKRAKNQKVQGIISTMRWEQTRWCLIRIPNDNMANQARIDYETIENQFFNSCFFDLKNHIPRYQELCDILNQGDIIRIKSSNTDLSFSTKGRKFIVFDGSNNLPDGEICTAPVTHTINGFIEFENPAVLGGKLIETPYLEWTDGVLTAVKAKTNQEYFASILRTDQGSSLIGEFAFGLNPYLTHFTNDILFDEKIAGTIHIAMGRAYPQCGGTNQSAIHWDIVKDTRKDGTVYLDGNPVFKNGEFLI